MFDLWFIRLVHHELENKFLHLDIFTVEKYDRYSLHQSLVIEETPVQTLSKLHEELFKSIVISLIFFWLIQVLLLNVSMTLNRSAQ